MTTDKWPTVPFILRLFRFYAFVWLGGFSIALIAAGIYYESFITFILAQEICLSILLWRRFYRIWTRLGRPPSSVLLHILRRGFAKMFQAGYDGVCHLFAHLHGQVQSFPSPVDHTYEHI